MKIILLPEKLHRVKSKADEGKKYDNWIQWMGSIQEKERKRIAN